MNIVYLLIVIAIAAVPIYVLFFTSFVDRLVAKFRTEDRSDHVEDVLTIAQEAKQQHVVELARTKRKIEAALVRLEDPQVSAPPVVAETTNPKPTAKRVAAKRVTKTTSK